MIAKNDFFANVSKGRLGNLQSQNKTRSLKQVNSGKNNGRKKTWRQYVLANE